MKIVFDKPLGSGNPYAPSQCCAVDPLTAIGVIGGIFSSLFGGSQQHYFTKEQQILQSKLNKEEMTHSMGLQRSQQEWMMNNMYGKQTSGMKNAGLNPAMANGSTPATPAGGSMSSGSSGPSAGMPNIAGAVSEIANIAADVELKQAEKKKVEAETKLVGSQTTGTDYDNIIKALDASPKMLKLREQGLTAEVQQAWAQVSKTANEAEYTMSLIQHEGLKMGLTIAETNQVSAAAAKYLSDIDVNMSQIEVNRAIQKAQKAAAVELYSRASLNASNANYLGALTKTENVMRNERKANMRNDTLLKGQQIELTDTEQKIKDYMLDSMDNIDPNSLEGKIYSRLDKIGDIAGKIIGAGASVVSAGRIGAGLGKQNHARNYEIFGDYNINNK